MSVLEFSLQALRPCYLGEKLCQIRKVSGIQCRGEKFAEPPLSRAWMVVIPEAVKVWKLAFRRVSIGYFDLKPPLRFPRFYYCKVSLLSKVFSCKEVGLVSFEQIATQCKLRETTLDFFVRTIMNFNY